MSRAITDDDIRRALDRWEIGVGAAEPHEELGWTREEYQHWTKTKEIPAAVESQQGVEVGSFLPPDVQEMIAGIHDTKFTSAPCDGSGGFGPPPDSDLIGWHACPGCENCKPSPTTLGDVIPLLESDGDEGVTIRSALDTKTLTHGMIVYRAQDGTIYTYNQTKDDLEAMTPIKDPPDWLQEEWHYAPDGHTFQDPDGNKYAVYARSLIKVDILLPTKIKNFEKSWVPDDDSPVSSDREPRKKKRKVDRTKLNSFVQEMPRWHVQLDGEDWTVRCDVHGLADEPNTFGGDVRKAIKRADFLNREYQMRYIDSLDKENI